MVKNKEHKKKLFQTKSYSKFKSIKNSSSIDNRIKKSSDTKNGTDAESTAVRVEEPGGTNDNMVSREQQENSSLEVQERNNNIIKMRRPTESSNYKLVRLKLPNMSSEKQEKRDDVLFKNGGGADSEMGTDEKSVLWGNSTGDSEVKSSIIMLDGENGLISGNSPKTGMNGSIILGSGNDLEENKSISFELYEEATALEGDAHAEHGSLDYINYETPEMGISLNDSGRVENSTNGLAGETVLNLNENIEISESDGIANNEGQSNTTIIGKDSNANTTINDVTNDAITVDENAVNNDILVMDDDNLYIPYKYGEESAIGTGCSLAFDDASSLVAEEARSTAEESPVSSFNLLNSEELEYSPKSIEFPENQEFYIYKCINWNEILPIINYISNLESRIELSDSPRAAEKERDVQLARVRKAKDKTRKREATLPTDTQNECPFLDANYLYFLKKVCSLTKRDSYFFCSDNARALVDRANKNAAAVLSRKRYFSDVDELGVTVFSILDLRVQVANAGDASQKKAESSIFLRRVKNINNIVCPPYDSLRFEYNVFKYKDDLVSISNVMEMDTRDVILIYYLYYNNVNIEIKDALLDMYVQDEWNMTDRILFEENFMRHGTKFNNFMMNKSGEDLKIYYKYYIKNYLPMNWTEPERATFSLLFNIYKKDWNAMQKNFHNKSSNDLKVFYSSYFKKLDEKERMKESQLCDFEGMANEYTPKKRGRKSKNKQ